MPAIRMEERVSLQVGGKTLSVTHLDKLLFPQTGFLKAHVIDYYIRAAPYLLPHLEGRPLTLKLYHKGISQNATYMKNAPSHTPAWVKTACVGRKTGGPMIRFILVNDLSTLVWAANLGNVEMHTFLAMAPRLHRPTMVVFDLDPGPPATVLECAEVALWLRARLAKENLHSYVKSSGSKGLHLVVPLNTPVTYQQTQAFAREVAEELARHDPDRVTTHMAKAGRSGKVFLDYSQNAAHKSTATVYSLRAREDGPFVSMPVDWDAVRRGTTRGNTQLFLTTPENALKQLKKHGDLFAPALRCKQRLPLKLRPTKPQLLPQCRENPANAAPGSGA